ncbi:LysE family translocator [Picosynechococcus sp. NKBG15041c]|uniref:LysE family translocator n=1 Tax=Picosynechococcus sp. NKBG15041c TaxID=1407650 RepID=UPI0003FCF6DE|nr:LysE family translocator [Picosynechococcus sp. NKBG15041c]
MGHLNFVYLFTTMVVLAALPSTSVALVVTRAATAGFRNGLAVASGIVAGDLVFVGLALLGLSTLAQQLGSVFTLIKIAGGLYLIWMGVGLIRSKQTFEFTVHNQRRTNFLESFLSGFALTLGDLKAIFFYASFFPAIVDMKTLGSSEAIAIVFTTIVTVGGVKAIYAYSAERLVRKVKSPKAQRVGKIAAGTAMVCGGTYLIFKH